MLRADGWMIDGWRGGWGVDVKMEGSTIERNMIGYGTAEIGGHVDRSIQQRRTQTLDAWMN